MKNIAAIILAGGESSRMKQPKAFLKFDNHITFVEKIIYGLYFGFLLSFYLAKEWIRTLIVGFGLHG